MRGLRMSKLSLCLTMLVVASAQAAENEPSRVSFYREVPHSYAGIGLFSASVERDPLDQAPGGLHVRLGGMVDEHWGVEARLARGVWHESQRLGAGRVQVDVSHLAGLYLTSRWAFGIPVIEIPAVPRMFVQAQAGLVDIGLKSEFESCTPLCSTTEQRDNHNDFSWGLGIGLEARVPQVQYPVGLSLEYFDHGEQNKIEITTVEAGIQFFF